MSFSGASFASEAVSTFFGDHSPLNVLELNLNNNNTLLGTTSSSDSDMIFDMQMTMGFSNRIHHFMFPNWSVTTDKAYYLTLAFVCAMCFLSEFLTHCKKKMKTVRRRRIRQQEQEALEGD